MSHRLFVRNVQARDQLEIFLVSSVSSLLLVRFFLNVSGYPQVGGGSLHIAHMLWGGLCMLASMVLLITFLGRRMQRLAALLGGVGFGIFIDEIGKFLTKDNNYFFRPAVGIIYAIFVILYLTFSFLGRRQKLSNQEYQINALNQLEEAVLRDMDSDEKDQVATLLRRANPNSFMTKQLKQLLTMINAEPAPEPNRFMKFVEKIRAGYAWLWRRRSSNVTVQIFFIVETVIFFAGVVYAIFHNFDAARDLLTLNHIDYGHSLVVGQLVSTIVAGSLAIVGVVRLRSSRLLAFVWFQRATLVNLLLTEFFIFSRIQFGALASFAFNLALLIVINFVLGEERKTTK